MNPAFARTEDERISWMRNLPFLAMHLVPLAAFFTHVTAFDWVLCFGLYVARMFFITGAYHRYFSHRSYKTSRAMQFLLGLGGTLAVQKGPLWWAGHHRHHHKHSDQQEDIHSPMKGLFWSHMGWIMCKKHDPTPEHLIKDFAKFPELRWLDKYHLVPPTILAVAIYYFFGLGALLIGFFLSTVITWHCTYFINSLTHLIGRRRYVTTDTSRNSFVLALLTLGEGWHNNHHYYQSSANQGFFWWEIDISYYVIKSLSFVGLVWDVRVPPQHVLQSHRLKDGHSDIGMFQANWAKAVSALDNAKAQIETAKVHAGEYVDERRRALDTMVVERREALDTMVKDTSRAAEEIARMTRKAVVD
jgi:stearoyl-CoA desaturase (delta-9 desaturase)